MKKLLSLMLALVMVLSMSVGAFAADTKPVLKSKLTATELKIANAYLQTVKTQDVSHLKPYGYPGIKYNPAVQIPDEITIDILKPAFTKVKDKSGLYRIDLSGIMVLSDGETNFEIMKFTSGILLKTKSSKTYSYFEVRGSETLLDYDKLDASTQKAVYDWLVETYDEDTAYMMTSSEFEEPEAPPVLENPNTNLPSTAVSPATTTGVKQLSTQASDYGEPKANNTAGFGQFGRIVGINVLDATFDLELKVNSATKDNAGYQLLFPDKYNMNSTKFDFYKVELEGRTFNFKNADSNWTSMIAPSHINPYGAYKGGFVSSYDKEFDGSFAWAYALSRKDIAPIKYKDAGSPLELKDKGYVYVAAPKDKPLEYIQLSIGMGTYFFKTK